MKIIPFESIVEKYKVIFFDAYGVLKNFEGVIEGAKETINYLEEKGIGYYVLTNDASRSPEQLALSFQKIGLPQITPQKVISSGMMAYEYLKYKFDHGRVAYMGTEESAHYIESLNIEAIPIQKLNLKKIDDVQALVFLDDEGFDWARDINKVVNLLRIRNIPVIVANSDRSYPINKKEVNIAIGGIADLIEDVTQKQFIRFGKPDAQMFIYAFEHILQEYNVDKKDILMVGDTLITDIIGGNKFGLDTALVLTGNTLKESYKHYIISTGIIPTYICKSIKLL